MMRKLESACWIILLALIVFFGGWRVTGLQPDAALYAGLSAKVLTGNEPWLISGSHGYFPLYFEHPPYFFQWGARVLDWLGASDGAARAIGGIPGCLGFLLATAWCWKRFGRSSALWLAFMLASFGHYTKFAATSMMEAPLSLGTVSAMIGVFEIIAYGSGARALALMCAGLALATASKGVAGLGALGGVALSLIWALFAKESRLRGRFFRVFVLLKVAGLAAMLPFFLWIYKMAQLQGLEWVGGYFVHQVVQSASSTRGDLSHEGGGSVFFYFKMIFLNGWPWWWSVPLGWAMIARTREDSTRFLAWIGFFFAASFFVPFSLVKFQLAHYIHPIYLVLLPVGAVTLDQLASAKWPSLRFMPLLRWIALAAAVGLVVIPAQGVSRTPNRGQPFIEAAAAIERLPDECLVLVSANEMDAYRMESYALWYWKAHSWKMLAENEFQAARASLSESHNVLWVPSSGELSGGKGCEVTR